MRLVLILLVLVSVLGYIPVAAQDTPCDTETTQAWKDKTFSILLRYDEAVENPKGLETALVIQALRREFDQIEIPNCTVEPDAKLFVKMLNFTADYLVAQAAEESSLADTLLAEATPIHDAVSGAFVGFTPSDGTTVAVVGQITSPVLDETVLQEAQVAGTYDVDLLEGNFLWLFVLAPNGLLYPQAQNSCPGDQRESIPLSRFDNTWRMTVYLGIPADSGKTFTLVLGLASPEANDQINSLFDSWCKDMNFTGLSQAELFDEMRVEPLQSINVIRQ